MNTLSFVATQARETLYSLASESRAAILMQFFKTDAGCYGEGDRFIGVRVPDVRAIAMDFASKLSPAEVLPLLDDSVHECRLLALLIWERQYVVSDEVVREEIFSLYTTHTRYINNWDLVDLSAYKIIGRHLQNRDRSLLYRWAIEGDLWQQRIAIVTTMQFVRNGDFEDTLRLSDILLSHPHDLIQKAVGWLLREVGKRDKAMLVDFLNSRHSRMPRTMLRYAIEKFSPEERALYMRRPRE